LLQEWDDELQEHEAEFHDFSSHALTMDFEKCVKCGRCVNVCSIVQARSCRKAEGYYWVMCALLLLVVNGPILQPQFPTFLLLDLPGPSAAPF
jgi:ferredoxin